MEQLNEEQRQAVMAGDGPALVLAGAGTGKTRVIVERIIWLIGERGVDPRNILALTFTNKAAGEMRSRIAARLEVDRLSSWVGTFHSFGLFILRREMEKLGRSPVFTIFDDSDQLTLMKRLLKTLPETMRTVSPRDALTWISLHKQELETPPPMDEILEDEEKTYRELWDRYHRALEQASAVDFDDLIALTARLFEEHPDATEKYRRRYGYILVDEYQDTNRAQYRIARALAGEDGNLFVVGDEDQGIYSWRGADIRNILEFEEDYPGAQVFRLEQNYRSMSPILAAANAVVANNKYRLGKNLWTKQKGGGNVMYYQARDAEDEARFVVESVAKEGADMRDVAVLFRTNGQARTIEEAFSRKGIAYVVVGGVKFYGRKEIKDLLSYLRLVMNPSDDESVRRVLNTPPRGVGAVTLARIEDHAAARHIPLLEVLRELEEDQTLSPQARKSTTEFVTLIDDLAIEAKQNPLAEIVEELIERTHFREYVQKSDEKDYRTRLELVDEFVNACAEFDKRKGGNVGDFLQELSLASDVDRLDTASPAVVLMTCHNAKGLEFDHVYLVGLEEGLLPHLASMDSDEEIEEERRLCYVAMTRARKSLTLTSAESRMLYGETRPREPSRFLGEIPRDRLQVIPREGDGHAAAAKQPAARVEANQLKMGTRVRHARFGKGTVMYTAGSGPKLKVRIRFDTGMSRQFMASATPLEILEGR